MIAAKVNARTGDEGVRSHSTNSTPTRNAKRGTWPPQDALAVTPAPSKGKFWKGVEYEVETVDGGYRGVVDEWTSKPTPSKGGAESLAKARINRTLGHQQRGATKNPAAAIEDDEYFAQLRRKVKG